MQFEVKKTLPNGLGRVGVIKTAHGEIKTPAFMVVGTQGFVRFVSNEDMHELNAQAMLSNGYHLRKKSAEIAEAGGLAEWSEWHGPTITDSGGFQVMSLGSGLGKVVSMSRLELEKNLLGTIPQAAAAREAGALATEEAARPREDGRRERRVPKDPFLAQDSGLSRARSSNYLKNSQQNNLVSITDDGVDFIDPFDETPDFIGPEESMQIQCRIGADIHMAFDELTSLADSYEYNIKALERTEKWAERSLREHIKHADDLGYHQNLYGVLQGGRWEDLRRRAARTLANMQVDGHEFDGFGLGGAFLKEDLGEILRWCNEELPFGKPRHLLGLSHPDDIFIGAEMGADTFDCVAPTREARHGKIYTRHGNINLRKCMDSPELLDHDCDCATCKAGWTRGQLRALWRSGDVNLKRQYYNLASIHNVRFIVRLTEEIRQAMLEDRFYEFKEEFLSRYYNN